MCIILGKLKGQEDFTTEQIKNAMSNNPDGNSITVINKGKLIAQLKTVDGEKFTKYRNSLMEQHKDNWKDFDVIYHFRIATNGEICNKNCHPFENKHNILWHNGVISEFSADKTKVDSEQFLNKYFTNNKITPAYFEKTCDRATSSKFVLFNKDTGEIFYSKNFTVLEDGKIASNNTYSYNYDSWKTTSYYNYDKYYERYYDELDKYYKNKYGGTKIDIQNYVYATEEMGIVGDLVDNILYYEEDLDTLTRTDLIEYVKELTSQIYEAYDSMQICIEEKVKTGTYYD